MRSQGTRNKDSATKTRNLRKLLHEYMEAAAQNDLLAVGERIRQARVEAGFTQDELSDLIGVGMRQVQYYEAGTSNPYRTLRRIAEATGKTVGWFLHGEPASEQLPGEFSDRLGALEDRLEELARNNAALLANQQAAMLVLQQLLTKQEASDESAQPRTLERRTAPRRKQT